jgi:glutamate/tyrosine decarboxylase-like PLP-dependent enzyme
MMVQMTMQVTEELAERIRPMTAWLPTIIELSFVRFRTRAAAAVSELLDFLSENPSPQEALDFHISEAAQNRLRRLLALNAAGLLTESEQHELDELEQLEHVVIMLKARIMAEQQ